MTDSQPFMLMVAGPNGSGKTTLTRYLRKIGVEFGAYINADDIAAELDGSYDHRVRMAQVLADRQREACLATRQSFSFETVMSHPSKVEFLKRATAAGYRTALFFVATDHPAVNVARVAQRVKLGGHDVAPETIVSRYNRVLALLPEAMRAAKEYAIFDNSTLTSMDDPVRGIRLVLRKTATGIERHPPIPGWLTI